jgi:hypothetical protein
VREDYRTAERDNMAKRHGFRVLECQE